MGEEANSVGFVCGRLGWSCPTLKVTKVRPSKLTPADNGLGGTHKIKLRPGNVGPSVYLEYDHQNGGVSCLGLGICINSPGGME